MHDPYNVKRSDLIKVGKYAKETDDQIVSRLKEQGDPTSHAAVGMHVLESDPDSFFSTLEWIKETDNA